ncbi:MAG: ABC-type transport auxiliary lipoprotein family protein [Syntrophobacteraceae bacterium]|nr:ABC-type transport auxiliary lipoprotein family protein [Syntrophobacteraceae bacterium]
MTPVRRNSAAPLRDLTGGAFPLRAPLLTFLRLLSCLFCLLLLPGCLQSLFPKSSPPQFYRIDYPFHPSSCAEPFPATVRIWPFNGALPYDRQEMIATAPGLQVRFSSHYQWVASPPDMIANDLVRDLSIGKVFENVASAKSSMAAAYGISGQLYRFDLEKRGASSYALLDLEITLWREKPRTVIFRKHFHYQSPPLTSNGPSEFAAAISELVSHLSMDLRNDLCTLSKDSSHPAGD